MVNFGNPRMTLGENIFTCICFFFYGLNYLVFFNGVVNVGDRLFDQFDYNLAFMSTYPLFLNWFNFFFQTGMTAYATFSSKFPLNILAHISFITYILLFILTPIELKFCSNDVVSFWIMIAITVVGGMPCQLNGTVFLSISGMFSMTHSAIYLVGMSAGGLLSSILRLIAGAIFKGEDNRYNDYFLSFYLNIIVVLIAYPLYFIMYFKIKFTKQILLEATTKQTQPDNVELEENMNDINVALDENISIDENAMEIEMSSEVNQPNQELFKQKSSENNEKKEIIETKPQPKIENGETTEPKRIADGEKVDSKEQQNKPEQRDQDRVQIKTVLNFESIESKSSGPSEDNSSVARTEPRQPIKDEMDENSSKVAKTEVDSSVEDEVANGTSTSTDSSSSSDDGDDEHEEEGGDGQIKNEEGVPLTVGDLSQPPTKEQIDVTGNESPLKGFIRVFTTIWVQFVAITIDYFWTFAVFAGIFLGIHYDEGSMKQSTSAQITTFMYMTGDMLARLLYFIPIPFNKWVIFGFSCVRCVLYVPIFIYYYNVYTNPYLMFFIMLVFSVSHGYFGSWAMQLAYKSVKFTDMNITGGLLALAPDIGLAFGATVLFILQLVLPSNVQASD